MTWSIDIRRFKNTYTCVELDRNGVVVDGELKVVKYKKNMWIFDIADGHTLDIHVSPTNGATSSGDAINLVTTSPTYVKDDLTFEMFSLGLNDRRFCQYSFGSAATLMRGEKYNAVSFLKYDYDSGGSAPVVFVVPRLHVENIPALMADSDCGTMKPWNQNSGTMKPKVKVIEADGHHFILEEITPCGEVAEHQITSTIQSQEFCPPTHVCNAYVAPGNLLRISISNHSKESVEVEVTPEISNMYKYDGKRIYVDAGAQKVVKVLSVDDIFRGINVKQLDLDIIRRITHIFRVFNDSSHNTAHTPKPPPLPVSHPPVIPPAARRRCGAPHDFVSFVPVVPPAADDLSTSTLQIMKQSLRTIQDEQKVILDRLLNARNITVKEFDILSLGVHVF